jgi:hypothetical protein
MAACRQTVSSILGDPQRRNADVIEKVRTLIMEARRLTVWEIADEVGISRGSANTILTEDLGMQGVAAKFVPKLLLLEQQQIRLETTQNMLECSNRDPEFLKSHGCTDMTQKPRSSCQWKHQHPQGQKKKKHDGFRTM